MSHVVEYPCVPLENVSRSPRSGAPLILVVEEDREISRLLCENLTVQYRVATAVDATEGLERAKALLPDLILSGVRPQKMGLQLIRALRTIQPLTATPIVILTARLTEEQRMGVLDAGAQDYLVKPFSMGQLHARIQNLLARKALGKALQDSEFQIHELLEQAPDGIFVADLNGRYVHVNGAGCRMLGYSREQILQKAIVDLIPPEDTARLWEAREKLLQGGTQVAEWRLRRHDGSYLPVEINAKILPGGRWQSFVRDMTGRLRADEQMRQAAAVFNNTMEAIVIADVDRNIVAVNPAFTRITGYQPHEVLGRNPRLQKSSRQDGEFYLALWKSLEESGQWQGEIWNRRKNGEDYPVWENISVVKDERGCATGYVSVMSDITSIKRAEARLRHLAHHDVLTDLPNRLTFSSHLEQALGRARRHQRKIALLLLDLDRFKSINDTLGHAAGDRLLEIIAKRLRNCVREEDLVARLGGDEFAIVLEEEARAQDAGLTAQKVLHAVAEPFHLGDHEVATSASIGISVYPDDAANAADLIKGADTAMYRAKGRGRHTYEFYTPELTALALKRLSIENDLRLALARKEFVLYYQPQIELASGLSRRVEALLRWRHPQHGLLLPEDFIEVAEESGLIDLIDDWVLGEACADLRRWLREGASPAQVAVNLSAREILYDHKVASLKDAMARSGFRSIDQPVQIDITESVLRSGENVVNTLNRFRQLGSSIAIDDFGTGYSSLSQLKHLPIDTLKVDRAFIRGIPDDNDNKAIVAAIVSMGHSLGLRVIAEGVETPRQLRFLTEQGVDEVQGFLFSEALAPGEIGRFMREHQPGRTAKQSN